MGSVINTNLDEHSPSISIIPRWAKEKYSNTDTNDYLYFTTTLYEKGNDEQIFNLLLNDIYQGAELIEDDNFPLNNKTLFRNAGVPVFWFNPDTEKLEVYFAALPRTGRLSRDLFWADKDLNTGIWSEPIQVPVVNTASWESHPTISNDGKILIFSSDREGGMGDIDIWVSFKDDNGNWQTPTNLGSDINTPGTDYMPMFTYNNDIIFSSNALNGSKRNDFDIYYATFDGEKWHSPKRYGFPINTEFNETGATIYENRIFLSSDRRGGCGGKDIYSFQICGPVIISGSVKSTNELLDGTINIFDDDNVLVASSVVESDGTFSTAELIPNRNYKIRYINDCYPLKRNDYNLTTPCSDSTVAKIVITMIMPEKHLELELTEIEIPFFVTGYYKPNTESTLNALKLSFSYNLYGTNNRSMYIENPQDNYNQYINQVEASLDEVVQYIAKMVEVLDNKCLPADKRGKLLIDVQGFADPRSISQGSEYLEEDIDDIKFNMKVRKGQKMDNDLLSKLRAYHTAKYFEVKLQEEFDELPDSINWYIQGRGVDTTEDIEDGLKRRVKIILQYLE